VRASQGRSQSSSQARRSDGAEGNASARGRKRRLLEVVSDEDRNDRSDQGAPDREDPIDFDNLFDQEPQNDASDREDDRDFPDEEWENFAEDVPDPKGFFRMEKMPWDEDEWTPASGVAVVTDGKPLEDHYLSEEKINKLLKFFGEVAGVPKNPMTVPEDIRKGFGSLQKQLEKVLFQQEKALLQILRPLVAMGQMFAWMECEQGLRAYKVIKALVINLYSSSVRRRRVLAAPGSKDVFNLSSFRESTSIFSEELQKKMKKAKIVDKILGSNRDFSNRSFRSRGGSRPRGGPRNGNRSGGPNQRFRSFRSRFNSRWGQRNNNSSSSGSSNGFSQRSQNQSSKP
jgi:hypothetical protein